MASDDPATIPAASSSRRLTPELALRSVFAIAGPLLFVDATTTHEDCGFAPKEGALIESSYGCGPSNQIRSKGPRQQTHELQDIFCLSCFDLTALPLFARREFVSRPPGPIRELLQSLGQRSELFTPAPTPAFSWTLLRSSPCQPLHLASHLDAAARTPTFAFTWKCPAAKSSSQWCLEMRRPNSSRKDLRSWLRIRTFHAVRSSSPPDCRPCSWLVRRRTPRRP